MSKTSKERLVTAAAVTEGGAARRGGSAALFFGGGGWESPELPRPGRAGRAWRARRIWIATCDWSKCRGAGPGKGPGDALVTAEEEE